MVNGLQEIRTMDLANRKALEAARREGPEAWGVKREAYLKSLRGWLKILRQISPIYRDAEVIGSAAAGETIRATEESWKSSR